MILVVFVECECVPQNVGIVIDETRSSHFIVTECVQFLVGDAVPHILQAAGAIQIQCVQLINAKVENASVDLYTLHSDWFGQLFYVNLNKKFVKGLLKSIESPISK